MQEENQNAATDQKTGEFSQVTEVKEAKTGEFPQVAEVKETKTVEFLLQVAVAVEDCGDEVAK